MLLSRFRMIGRCNIWMDLNRLGCEIKGTEDACQHMYGFAHLSRIWANIRLAAAIYENGHVIGENSLVFTQYTSMGLMLKEYIQSSMGCETFFLHGGLARKERDMMIERFQEERSSGEHTSPSRVFVLSIKAGGLGLNLTAANHVFHYDRWWNPAVENQATDRAYRIGQNKPVQVHKLISTGTLEEKIDGMIERKKDLSQRIIQTTGKEEEWITPMSNEQLRHIFSLSRDAIVQDK
jgi:SNF2 family DNA or RNA helicase